MKELFKGKEYSTKTSVVWTWTTPRICMERMFNNVSKFNQSIGSWNMDNVTNMGLM